jgi:hypothetical protein
MDALEITDTMRKALADGRKVDAALLLPHLHAAVSGEAAVEWGTYPVCAACHGIAELFVPDLGKNVNCQVEPDVCPGNKHGRMTPQQFETYMTAKLTKNPLPEGVEEAPAADAPVPRADGEGLAAYLKRRAERFGL